MFSVRKEINAGFLNDRDSLREQIKIGYLSFAIAEKIRLLFFFGILLKSKEGGKPPSFCCFV
jgi:hypothetical protein